MSKCCKCGIGEGERGIAGVLARWSCDRMDMCR